MTIHPRYGGVLSVRGVGRVGTYEAAVAARRCRARSYWVIEEQLPEVKVTHGETNGRKWESRTNHEEREDLGHFKTKTAVIQFLIDYAKEKGLEMEGDITGYPWLKLPRWLTNAHKDSIMEVRHQIRNKKVMPGEPKATEAMTVEQLKAEGCVGLYEYPI